MVMKMKSKYEGKFCPEVNDICKLKDCVYYWTDGENESCAKVASVRSMLGISKTIRESITTILEYIQRK